MSSQDPSLSYPLSGAKRKRSPSMELTEIVPSRIARQIIARPLRRGKKKKRTTIYKFKRSFNPGSTLVTSDGVNPTLLGFNFSMNDMPGYTELTTLFDFYKLTGVKVRVMPYYQDNSISNGTLNNVRNAPIFYAIDRSDGSAPTTVDELLEYQDHKISSAWKGFSIWIPSPKFADATSAARGGWVATSNPSLNWYGLKISIPPTGAANQWYTTWTYYVSCKDPK